MIADAAIIALGIVGLGAIAIAGSPELAGIVALLALAAATRMTRRTGQ